MPTKPKRSCLHRGCLTLTSTGYCEDHQQSRWKRVDQQRGNSHERGYDHKWRKARKLFLMDHPLCKHCEKEEKLTPANVVDHIIPHKGNVSTFWDENNWQPLCKSCHDSKTAKEDGGGFRYD